MAPAPRPASTEGGVAWTPELRRLVHPRRGDPAPATDLRAAWGKIRANLRARPASEVKADLSAALRARLEADEAPAALLGAEDEALLFHLASRGTWAHSPDRALQATVVDVWVALGGVVAATANLVAATRVGPVHENGGLVTLATKPAAAGTSGEAAGTAIDGPWARLRAHLCGASGEALAAAKAVVAPWEGASPSGGRADALARNLAFAFDDADWTDRLAATLGSQDSASCLALSARDLPTAAYVVKTIGRYHAFGWKNDVAALVATWFDRYGPAAAAEIAPWLDDELASEWRTDVARALAHCGTEEAVQALASRLEVREVLPAMQDAARRFPAAAAAALARPIAARAKTSPQAQALLDRLVREDDGAIRASLDALPPATAAVLRAAFEKGAPPAEEAAPGELPAVLADPPWRAGRKAAAAAAPIALGPLPFAPSMAWKPGVREAWSGGEVPVWMRGMVHSTVLGRLQLPASVEKLATADDPVALQQLRAAVPRMRYLSLSMLRALPDRLARILVREVPASSWYSSLEDWQLFAARWELEAFDEFLRFASADPEDGLALLEPFRHPGVAPLAAHALAHLKKARDAGRRWLLAHPEAAAAGLVPDAVGRPSKERDAAQAALRLLAGAGHREVVLEVAGRWSPEARAAAEAVLAFDPLALYPSKLPKMPEFWSAVAFARPVLRSGKALPVAAVEALGAMLAFSAADAPYAGLAQVKDACAPASLAAFAWDLFSAWQVAGWPSKEAWAFRALGVFGDDACARRLAPLIRAWPGEAAHARAVAGLDVLAAIGTDVALMHLNGIAQKVKFKGLQEKAREKIAEIADARGFTPEELADRLVPDLGLDERGTLALDFGPRRFVVGFDELLKPYVRDEAGKRLPDLPKPGKADDPEKAPQAVETFKALKKDVKTLASMQLARLELAMCTQRRWTPEVFATFLAGHPLLGHVVRRLVWGVYAADGSLVDAFRVAEDGALVDRSDDPYELPEGVTVGVAHPLDLPEDLAADLGQQLADYEILQPFRQLGREAYRLAEAERAATELTRYDGVEVPTGKVLGLEARGWARGAPQDGGVSWWYEKPLPGGLEAVLTLEPGIVAGAPDLLDANQQLKKVTVVPRGRGGYAPSGQRLGVLGAVAASELLRDLEALRA